MVTLNESPIVTLTTRTDDKPGWAEMLRSAAPRVRRHDALTLWHFAGAAGRRWRWLRASGGSTRVRLRFSTQPGSIFYNRKYIYKINLKKKFDLGGARAPQSLSAREHK